MMSSLLCCLSSMTCNHVVCGLTVTRCFVPYFLRYFHPFLFLALVAGGAQKDTDSTQHLSAGLSSAARSNVSSVSKPLFHLPGYLTIVLSSFCLSVLLKYFPSFEERFHSQTTVSALNFKTLNACAARCPIELVGPSETNWSLAPAKQMVPIRSKRQWGSATFKSHNWRISSLPNRIELSMIDTAGLRDPGVWRYLPGRPVHPSPPSRSPSAPSLLQGTHLTSTHSNIYLINRLSGIGSANLGHYRYRIVSYCD